jgi:hypothetical protein
MGDMRTSQRSLLGSFLAALLLLVAGAGSAAAQSAERYDVTFEGVTSNCAKDRELALAKGSLVINSTDKEIKLRLERTAVTMPELVGSQRRGGKIKADATATDAQGRRQRITASGRVEDGAIQLLFIAELYDEKGGSLCSQSWNVTGKRGR